MTEHPLSDTDAVLRERITELSVHIPCGWVRGPVHRRGPWQSCPDEDSPEKWEGCDVSQECDLCLICLRGTAGGISRWAWLGCRDCRSINDALQRKWGGRPLALGRHSLMNGIGIYFGGLSGVVEAQMNRVVEFARNFEQLWNWRDREFRRLAADFDPLADVPLRTWQEKWPPGWIASADAISRLLGRELPLNPPKRLG